MTLLAIIGVVPEGVAPQPCVCVGPWLLVAWLAFTILILLALLVGCYAWARRIERRSR